jgi:predicted transcriptional regulator
VGLRSNYAQLSGKASTVFHGSRIHRFSSEQEGARDLLGRAGCNSVYEALALMAAKGVAAVLVISEGHLVGIVSARDYGREVVLKDKSSRDVRVREIMTTSLS